MDAATARAAVAKSEATRNVIGAPHRIGFTAPIQVEMQESSGNIKQNIWGNCRYLAKYLEMDSRQMQESVCPHN
jgi:hypothetical protein